ncbi:Uncharacterised protein [Klebsiella pneumoniae]|uniref:hypothetical protein n=1 Tax=Klebsiella pneumoniae TaxID=573 RepID=UPI002277B9BD|nr:hypothetical protein [Klebsiella pneumoniae]CAH1462886.1 Uncharacterised protein [Klebsiella pneumoniae]CAH1465737.1 Uncharacterised protein [Klebsiella pneumoniae]CAH1466981.1 Uncharacterised protein [Klebsiella pneumoniae]
MTTDITELAQREKFEAWFKSSFHPDKTGPYIKDQLYFAWKAAGAELVEALEKAQQRNAKLESRTVNVKLPTTIEPTAFSPWVAKAFYQFHKDTVKSCFAVFSDACAAAGIKMEAE